MFPPYQGYGGNVNEIISPFDYETDFIAANIVNAFPMLF